MGGVAKILEVFRERQKSYEPSEIRITGVLYGIRCSKTFCFVLINIHHGKTVCGEILV